MATAQEQSCQQSDTKLAQESDLFPFTLTDAERIEYQKAAERCGLSLTAWIYSRLHEAAKREAKEA